MRNFIILLVVILSLTGCSRSVNLNQGIVKSSQPIFVENKPLNKKTYIKFTNTSNVDSNLTAALKDYFSKSGYEIVENENLASISIKGNLDYFSKKEVYTYPYHPMFFWGRRYYYDDFYRDTEYIYDAGVSLLLRIKTSGKVDEYTTNLTFTHSGYLYSFGTITEILNYQIYKKTHAYLENFQNDGKDEKI